MFFKIKFGDFIPILERKFSSDEQFSPIFYYEDEVSISIFRQLGTIGYYTELNKELIPDFGFKSVEDFKLQYLTSAYELVEMPRINNNVNLKISQE